MKTAADPVDANDVEVAQLEEAHVDGTVEAADHWSRPQAGYIQVPAEGRGRGPPGPRRPEYLGINITDKSMADIEYDLGQFQLEDCQCHWR